jgi:hypothetical protein
MIVASLLLCRSTTNLIKKLNSSKCDPIYFYFQNAGGIRTKLNKFRINVSIEEYDVIILVETWLYSDFKDSELGLCNYTVFRADRNCVLLNKFRGGGVLVAVHKRIRCSKILAMSQWRLVNSG